MLHDELEALFGKHTVDKAGEVDPSKIDAPSVQAAVGALSRLRGQPEAQILFVRAMAEDLAVAVCRWLADKDFWKAVVGVQIH